MKKSLYIAAFAVAGAGFVAPVVAQETTAAGSMNTQMSWAALKNLIDQAVNQSKIATITAEDAKTKAEDALTLAKKIEACGNKGMIYASGAVGADAQGCIMPPNGTLSGVAYSSTGTKSYNLPKTAGMDVQISCKSTGQANSTSKGSGRKTVSVLGRIRLNSGWVKMFEDSDSCHVYSDSGSCSVSASGNYFFYEKGGVLYRYTGALNMANGVAVMGSSKFTNLSNWTGGIEVTGNECTVAVGR